MKRIKYFIPFFVITSLISSTSVQGQTLFSNPDTTPNYRGYKNIEECQIAAERITEIEQALHRDTIWWDTVSYIDLKGLRKKLNVKPGHETPRPESAIEAASICLEKFNADTVKVLSLGSVAHIIKILLIANREQDAERLAHRFLDSLRQEYENSADKKNRYEYKRALRTVAKTYVTAKPRRYGLAKPYNRQLLQLYKNDNDSLYYSIDAALELAIIAEGVKDSTEAKSFWELALRFNDSTPEEERRNSPLAAYRLDLLANFVIKDTEEESLDSIAVSNVAYNLWLANKVKYRIYGGKLATNTDEFVQPKKITLSGDYYYVSDNLSEPDAATQGKSTYTKKGTVPKGKFPIKNSINYIVGLPSLCPIETENRSQGNDGHFKLNSGFGGCWVKQFELRDLKQKFPGMEIVGLSSTYGTVGQLAPLTPDQEADTLAKLFLGFYRMPVHLIVENTEFIRLAEPDGRRLDLETPNSLELNGSVKDIRLEVIIDKEGYRLYLARNIRTDWFKRFYEILNNRPDK